METKKNRKKYDLDYKRKIVQEYLDGKLTAQQIADREGLIPGQIYNWRVQVENRARHERVEAIQAENPQSTLEQARRIQELEEELEDYRQKVADQSMMIDLSKKTSAGLSIREKVEWVRRNKGHVGSVKKAAEMMQLNSATYYHQPKVTREDRERFDAHLRDQVERVQIVHPRAGYRTVRQYLSRLGIRLGERRLRRVMGKFGLQARLKRAFVRTTDSKHSHRVYPNLIKGMLVTGVDQIWVSDITYIRIDNGFVYLAVILDLFSRRVVGWSLSKQIDGDLATAALRMAIGQRNPKPGIIHHSDRGVQYLCNKYVARLQANRFHISNSAKGNPYDNALAESFMKTLK